ncbi:MAG: glycosyltransferase family 2 protein [Candidatus Omnitrophica bacterium]|nr:glycosyltransferase family 2 protein [Candidatus Omnitrophota bacterium]
MDPRSLTIFLPAYNEEKGIDGAISKILHSIESIVDDYEILVINDGSTDGTREKVLMWQKKNNRIRLIDHKGNLGYGATLRTGFKSAGKELILYTDADMPVDPNEIRNILPHTKEHDMVVGYRVDRKDKLCRFIYSAIYNSLLKVLFKIPVRDANFSFKCIHKKALSKCRLGARSVFIDGELLAEAVRSDLKIKEIPIAYKPREYGKSNFDSLGAAFFTLRELIGYRLRRFLRKRD